MFIFFHCVNSKEPPDDLPAWAAPVETGPVDAKAPAIPTLASLGGTLVGSDGKEYVEVVLEEKDVKLLKASSKASGIRKLPQPVPQVPGWVKPAEPKGPPPKRLVAPEGPPGKKAKTMEFHLKEGR